MSILSPDIRLPVWPITCDRYHEMIRAGVLNEGDAVELIEGQIVKHMAIGPAHSSVVSKLLRLLMRHFGETVIIRSQDPITLDDHSEPEPDLVVAKPSADFYATRHPGPEDVLLVIEVADTSLNFDRSAKLPLYAACGIAEAWLVDLTTNTIQVCRRPVGTIYGETKIFCVGEQIALPGLADVTVAVADIVG